MVAARPKGKITIYEAPKLCRFRRPANPPRPGSGLTGLPGQAVLIVQPGQAVNAAQAVQTIQGVHAVRTVCAVH